jgi:hypothetical protein
VKFLLITFVLMLAPGVSVAADFNAGMGAYERRDYTAAVREFRALAEAGDPHAQYMLARLHAQGNGVLQDYVEAHKWFNLAASRGHRHAAQARDDLARHMNSNQISKAQRQAGQWKPDKDVAAVQPAPVASDGRSWPRLMLHDTFRDGDYSRDPAWRVAAGQFQVQWNTGLRSMHESREARVRAETRAEDLPMAILNAILGNRQEATVEPPDYAEIHTDQSISNAFNIQMLLTLHQPAPGPFAFGPFQGDQRSNGYRLAYTPDVSRGLHLLRLTDTGSSVLASVDPQLGPNRQYSIQWTRDARHGEMAVSIDGKEVIRVADAGLTDSFNGFTIINRGGDYSLREIAIHGVD